LSKKDPITGHKKKREKKMRRKSFQVAVWSALITGVILAIAILSGCASQSGTVKVGSGDFASPPPARPVVDMRDGEAIIEEPPPPPPPKEKLETLISFESNSKGLVCPPSPDEMGRLMVARSQAGLTDARAEILRKYAENPEKYQEAGIKAGVVSGHNGGFPIVVWNLSPYTLSVGVTGDPNIQMIGPQGHGEFVVPDKRFSVYSNRVLRKGEVPYKEGKIRIETPTPEVPFKGKIFSHMVRIH